MKRTVLNLMIALALVLVPVALATTTVYAACAADTSSKGQVISGIGETGSNCNGEGVTSIVATITNLLSIVIGIAAVLAILNAGFKYISSGGESGKVSNAKNTLIYALAGVAIAALAQFMVHFVLHQASNATQPACKNNASILASDPKCH